MTIDLGVRDENRVKIFLERKGCTVVSIKRGSCERKQPDFEVVLENIKFNCEVKAIFPSSGDPLNNISENIHEAFKQFNGRMSQLPNVLVMCNHHDNDWVNSLDLKAVLTGHFYLENGNKDKIYGRYSDARIKEEKFKTSLYIWLTKDDRVVYVFTDKKGKEIMIRLSDTKD